MLLSSYLENIPACIVTLVEPYYLILKFVELILHRTHVTLGFHVKKLLSVKK